MATSRELREKRCNVVKLGRDIVDKAEQEKREVTSEEMANFTAYMRDADTLKEQIDQIETLERHESELRSSQGVAAGRPDTTAPGYRGAFDTEAMERGLPADPQERRVMVEKATESYLRYGMSLLSQEERYLLTPQFDMARRSTAMLSERERRALSIGVDTAGGILVPEGFYQMITSAQRAYGGMRKAATTLTTTSGQDLPMPTDNDTSNKGHILGEGQLVADTDPSIGAVVLRGYMYTSDEVKVSFQLLEDSGFPLVPWLSQKLGTRIARGLNADCTNGSGASKPRGITLDSPSVLTTASPTMISYDELVRLKHSVDPSYREQGGRWMFNDGTLLGLKLLKDGNGRPLWIEGGVANGAPDRFDGDEYIINQDMPTIGASVVAPVLYGLLSLYHMRDIGGTTLLQLRERYANNLQVAFIAFERHDGALIDAGTHPVASITMHS